MFIHLAFTIRFSRRQMPDGDVQGIIDPTRYIVAERPDSTRGWLSLVTRKRRHRIAAWQPVLVRVAIGS